VPVEVTLLGLWAGVEQGASLINVILAGYRAYEYLANKAQALEYISNQSEYQRALEASKKREDDPQTKIELRNLTLKLFDDYIEQQEKKAKEDADTSFLDQVSAALDILSGDVVSSDRSEAAKKAWETRKELYGPSGRKGVLGGGETKKKARKASPIGEASKAGILDVIKSITGGTEADIETSKGLKKKVEKVTAGAKSFNKTFTQIEQAVLALGNVVNKIVSI